MASVYSGLIPTAPLLVPVGAIFVSRMVGASWPLAIIVGVIAIPIVWAIVYDWLLPRLLPE